MRFSTRRGDCGQWSVLTRPVRELAVQPLIGGDDSVVNVFQQVGAVGQSLVYTLAFCDVAPVDRKPSFVG